MGDQFGWLFGQCFLNEILIEVSYFIFGDEFIVVLVDMYCNGCWVVLLINSLVINDVIVVYVVYVCYCLVLLCGGVEVYELQVNVCVCCYYVWLVCGWGCFKFSLYIKVMVFDCKELFVGLFNLDLCLVNVNMEMGYYVDSEVLVGEVVVFVEEGMVFQNSYWVMSDDQGLLWGVGDEWGLVQY